ITKFLRRIFASLQISFVCHSPTSS
ncbi:hypothetical protein ACJX0J_041530, partial [Zea mays]